MSLATAIKSAIVRALENDERIGTILLFGSQSRDQATSKSDIDIGVLLQPGAIPVERYTLLRQLLLALASEGIAQPVDLVLLNDAPPALAFRALRDGEVLFCADEVGLHRFRVQTYDRHADFAHAENIFRRATKRRASGQKKNG